MKSPGRTSSGDRLSSRTLLCTKLLLLRLRRFFVIMKNQTVAVIGAGDFIGAEIAKKFAAEGFTLFVGRRNGDKLAPLVKEIEVAGGSAFARSLDARKEGEIVSFLSDADKQAPLEV